MGQDNQSHAIKAIVYLTGFNRVPYHIKIVTNGKPLILENFIKTNVATSYSFALFPFSNLYQLDNSCGSYY